MNFMKRGLNRGNAELDGIILLLVLISFFILAPKGTFNFKSPGSSTSGGSWFSSGPIQSQGSSSYRSQGGTISAPTLTSSYSSLISIDRGNASYATESYNEYITVDNRGENSVDITGWQLRNGKDHRSYSVGSSLQRFSADTALIPRAALVLSPTGMSAAQDVVLKPGERAIVTTGSVGIKSPYQITSFKENICTGYIEGLPEYAFEPPLNMSCPSPSNEPGAENLDRACIDYLGSMSSCHTPEFNTVDRYGNVCSNCVDSHPLSSQCVAFIKEHFSYQGCLANHSSDPNFSGNTWRIFLGRGWEMWSDKYETIELYDKQGKLAAFQNY